MKLSIVIAALAVISVLLASCGTSSTRRASTTPSTSVPPARNTATGYSRGFDFYNLSSNPLTFVSATEWINGIKRSWDSQAPPNGSVLPPGGHQNFQVTFHLLADTSVTVQYSAGNRTSYTDLNVPAAGDSTLSYTYPNGTTCPTAACNFGGTTATFLDAPGTVHEIPSQQGQDQAQILNQLCVQSNQAKCTFTPIKEEIISGPQTIIDPVITNMTKDDEEYTFSCKNSIGWSDSIGGKISVEAGLGKIVEASVEVEYKHDISANTEYEATLVTTIRPGYYGWVTHSAPMYREWGDFSVTMGNTAWHLTTIYFDFPNSTGDLGHRNNWTAHTQPIGPPDAPVTRTPAVVRATGVQKVATGDNGVNVCNASHA